MMLNLHQIWCTLVQNSNKKVHFLKIIYYPQLENWWKYDTRYKNKGAGTKMLKCLVEDRVERLYIIERTDLAIDKKYPLKQKGGA